MRVILSARGDGGIPLDSRAARTNRSTGLRTQPESRTLGGCGRRTFWNAQYCLSCCVNGSLSRALPSLYILKAEAEKRTIKQGMRKVAEMLLFLARPKPG